MRHIILLLSFIVLIQPINASSSVQRTASGKDPLVVQNYYKVVNHILTGNFQTLRQLLDAMEDSRQLTVNGTRQLEMFYEELLAMDSDLVNRWCSGAPDSPHPFIVRAKQRIRSTTADRDQALQQARQDLETAHKLSPENPASAATLIAVCTLSGCTADEMEQWFGKATQADPFWISAYTNKLIYLAPDRFGSKKQMEDFAVSCAENSPQGSTVYSVLLTYFNMLNAHHYSPYPFQTHALRLPKRAHELLLPTMQKYKADFAHSTVPLYYEGLYTFLRGKRTAAEFILNGVINLEPENLAALKALVVVQMSGDKWEKARKSVAKILELAPKDPFGLTNMGAIHTLLLNDRKKTGELYRQAIELEKSQELQQYYESDLANLMQYSGS